MGRLAKGEDDQGLSGLHRGPHPWLQVSIEVFENIFNVIFINIILRNVFSLGCKCFNNISGYFYVKPNICEDIDYRVS